MKSLKCPSCGASSKSPLINGISDDNQALLQSFVQDCEDYALFLLDAHGFIISWNSGAEIIKGYKEEEILGKHFSIFYPPEAVKNHFPEYELEMASKHGRFEDLGWRVRKGGSRFWANVIITAIKDDQGKTIGYGKVTRDLTERKNFEEKINFLLNHDMLTGLYNRTAFIETLKRELNKSRRNDTSVAVLMLDVDDFKNINDSYGHYIGDKLLISIADKLQQCVRKEDFVARLGGDEFVIIFPNIKNESDIELLAQKLLARFKKPVKLESHCFYSTVSIGISVSSKVNHDCTSLVKNADIALSSVKNFGHSNYQFFSDELSSMFKKNSELQSLLPLAIANNELFLVFQPQYNLSNRRIVGIEALLRWQQSQLGLIMPDDFIPIAEKSGIIVQLGEWVLKTACTQYMSWLAEGLVSKEIKLAVNVSPLQLSQEKFIDSFMLVLKDSKIPPQYLELELTETAVMLNSVDLDAIFRQLQNIGVSIAIDDFGTGYSSLSRIKELPVSTLKIDRSFIQGIDKTANDATLVKSIITLGKNLGLTIISEGVETEEQIQILSRYRCKIVQGFYFGEKPLRREELTQLLREQQATLSK
ncbi:putative bifunctional diguanylate cyclase/phosphodiesterase [Legionella jordanis]|uniref:Inner membrane protein/sensory box protein LssE n=1 Tax=Legionella jordanis TaxID=456 RepID=A0A0W0VAK4_9GAMM|nr:GGDEF domain-containing phosphodiesterase [Legionella jordanis]KTD16886.1 inner membrane protein/sensory box protein LssE [Legionella jordanis]RMX00332.1 phosphodiesterase [Legionella jordanis]RMX15513.1 phosphodiesterase [Legionella jordanis]VEH13583.1 inner membrane protein PLUS sensory box protein LssE [Legionella jordanis]